jgi:hypothetical protein
MAMNAPSNFASSMGDGNETRENVTLPNSLID